MERGRARLKWAGPALLALGLLVVQLCLPGLQTSMLRLAPTPATHAEHEGHGRHGPAGESEAGKAMIACAICAAALLPAAPVDLAGAPAPCFHGRVTVALTAPEALREQALAAPFARGPPALS
jgi:hypothetical protein